VILTRRKNGPLGSLHIATTGYTCRISQRNLFFWIYRIEETHPPVRMSIQRARSTPHEYTSRGSDIGCFFPKRVFAEYTFEETRHDGKGI
jgi:hypothetical protein